MIPYLIVTMLALYTATVIISLYLLIIEYKKYTTNEQWYDWMLTLIVLFTPILNSIVLIGYIYKIDKEEGYK